MSAQPVSEQRVRGRPLWSLPAKLKLFASVEGGGRSRRPTDMVLLVLCLFGLVVVASASTPPTHFWKTLADLSTSVPGFFEGLWRILFGLMTAWALILLVASLLHKRLDVFRDLLLAMLGAGGAVLALESIVGGTARSLWDAATATGPPPDSVSVRVALAVGLTTVASPYISRPFRAVSWWLNGAGAVSAAVLGSATPSGVVLGFLCGVTAAAVVRIVFGSIGGRPSLAHVTKGLSDIGLEVVALSEVTAAEAGVVMLNGNDSDGRPLLVKVYGRDAWDAQLAVRAWRALWFRNPESLSFTRLGQVEHEGFVTLLAGSSGVPTQEVLRAGRTPDNDAVIVVRVRGLSLESRLGAASTETVEAAWDTVLSLGRAGLMHGDLHPGALRVDGEIVVIESMAGATVATNQDQRRIDLAQLLTLSVVLVGVEDGLGIAKRRLGRDDLAAVVPYIQKPALGARLREAASKAHVDVDDLRNRTAAKAEIEAPKIAGIRRVSTSTLVQAVMLAAAGYFLVSTLSGVDFNELVDALRSASLPVLLLALVIAQLPRFAYAEALQAACPRPIPYGPVALLQFAMTFINLVFPNTVARMAVNIRFLQKQGIPASAAVSIGFIDNMGGLAVEILVVLAAVVFGLGDLHLNLHASGQKDGDLLHLIELLIVLVLAVAVLLVAVSKLRNWLFNRIRPWLSDIRETVASLRSPSKVIRILLGNLGAEVLFAGALGMVLVALNSPLPLMTVLVVNVSVGLFASLIPVPGGIGITEGALVVGLTAAGLDQSTAFAAAICYRLCSYYLPPIWGWFAFRHLERTGLL